MWLQMLMKVVLSGMRVVDATRLTLSNIDITEPGGSTPLIPKSVTGRDPGLVPSNSQPHNLSL
jgi:hypothetical protein